MYIVLLVKGVALYLCLVAAIGVNKQTTNYKLNSSAAKTLQVKSKGVT